MKVPSDETEVVEEGSSSSTPVGNSNSEEIPPYLREEPPEVCVTSMHRPLWGSGYQARKCSVMPSVGGSCSLTSSVAGQTGAWVSMATLGSARKTPDYFIPSDLHNQGGSNTRN
ncbi:uncharacterized protein zgc:101566 isoform X2 [Esox lucius]|uniref:uncharacterized protein zgc:101566 isoform X2 n=1 Tax=Esox lucius TaxID=8010 RepID=UPI0009732E4C|nr:uncharacterized protein zgc:101566 isoform X2 [Esox lucius]